MNLQKIKLRSLNVSVKRNYKVLLKILISNLMKLFCGFKCYSKKIFRPKKELNSFKGLISKSNSKYNKYWHKNKKSKKTNRNVD
jgi:hypothetical protein